MDFYVCFLLCHLSYSSIFYISCKLVNFKCLNKFNFFGIDSAVCFPWLHIWRYHFSDANIDEWVLNLFLGFFSNLTFCLFSLSSPASESCDHVLPGLPSMLHSISGWPAHPFTWVSANRSAETGSQARGLCSLHFGNVIHLKTTPYPFPSQTIKWSVRENIWKKVFRALERNGVY